MNENVFKAALTGLLHDIGKFLGRASPEAEGLAISAARGEAGQRHATLAQDFIRQYVPERFQEVMAVVAAHHQPELLKSQGDALYTLAATVRLADQVAAGGEVNGQPPSSPAETLEPILSHVALIELGSYDRWYYQPNALYLRQKSVFPSDKAEETTPSPTYQALWGGHFKPALESWKDSSDWPGQSPQAYLTTLLALLQQYLFFVPASSPWPEDEDDLTWPDVSLYHHLKVTAAVAACLADHPAPIETLSPTSDQPLAYLVRADLSGIQSFIYRITKSESDTSFEHVAKRLRGRSFYLSLLNEVLADWLMRELGLPPTNVLYASGGQIDLLIPLNQKAALEAKVQAIETWLLKTFQGNLGLQFALAPLTAADFGDMRRVNRQLNQALSTAKGQKWLTHLNDEDFFIPPEPLYHLCSVCHITPLDDPQVCGLCKNHREIGQRLPHASHLAFVYRQAATRGSQQDWVAIPFENFGVEVILLKSEQVEPFVQTCDAPATLFHLNPQASFIRPAQSQLGQAFKFLANAAPVAEEKLQPTNMQPVEADDVLHFDALAELSEGVKHIGILKADVDRLGLLFSEGLAVEDQGLRPSMARVIAMSNALDLFFAGWLNLLCEQVFQSWHSEQAAKAPQEAHPWRDKVKGLFYVMYSGGDDLFMIGPWEAVLHLARELQADFARYACQNLNLTLSAGIVQVRPHYPVQRFATLVSAAEEQAKHEGRARVTVFNQTLGWTEAHKGLGPLLDLGEKLRGLLEEKKMPRGLLHDLGRLYQVHRIPGENNFKPMWTPRIFYTMARRLSQETLEEVGYELIEAMKDQKIMVPISYAGFITRKE